MYLVEFSKKKFWSATPLRGEGGSKKKKKKKIFFFFKFDFRLKKRIFTVKSENVGGEVQTLPGLP